MLDVELEYLSSESEIDSRQSQAPIGCASGKRKAQN